VQIATLEALLLQPPSSQAPSRLLTHSSNLSQLISQKLAPSRDTNPLRRCARGVRYFLEDNWKRVWVMSLWLAINAALFTWKFIYYSRHPTFAVMGYCVCVAKGGAETTKFNMAVILLPVCRNTITWLRSRTRLGAAVPFNDNINFHKVVAAGAAVGVALHAVTHLTCDFPRLLHASDAAYEPMKRYFGQTRIPNYWWFVRGVEGVTGVIMVVLMVIAYTLAHPWFRRGKLSEGNPLRRLSGFNMFWYSHHLFVIVYIAFVVHGVCLYITRTWYQQTVIINPLSLSLSEVSVVRFVRLYMLIVPYFDTKSDMDVPCRPPPALLRRAPSPGSEVPWPHHRQDREGKKLK
jgi:respiratory burst oxidase